MSVGKVVLIGAGPGDPGLITVKGLEVLRRADVVIYDRLIPMELLNEIRSDAERIDAGKRKHDHRLKQHEINALLVEYAQKGLLVARLKGGDPFVFGRGGEEALACHAAGIPFEIIPGVTSAVAVPAYAGVPVTHRLTASAFTVVTGHNAPEADDSEIDYPALAAAARLGTLVILMGATYLPKITARLIECGVDPDAPALSIESGTTPQQRTIAAPLSKLADTVLAAGFDTPMITVIGEVTRLPDQGLRWFSPPPTIP